MLNSLQKNVCGRMRNPSTTANKWSWGIATVLAASALMAWTSSAQEVDLAQRRMTHVIRGRLPRPAWRCLSINCTNGRCLHGPVGCNGIDDCGDNSDERNCTAYQILSRCTDDGRQDWISNGPFCYYMSSSLTDFDSAVRQCHVRESQLISIHSEEESQFLVHTIRALSLREGRFGHSSYWIGLQEVQYGTYDWLDGTPLAYENWNAGEPNSPNETCVEMYTNGFWNDAPCRTVRGGYICKVLAKTNAPKENCGEPAWMTFNGSRYMLVDNQEETWYNAEEICYSHNARLAFISSENEWRWITEVLLSKRRGDYSAWIEGSAIYNDSRFNNFGGYSEDLMSMYHCRSIVKDRKLRLYGLLKADNCFRRMGLICKDDRADDLLSNNTSCVLPFIYNGTTVSHCLEGNVTGSSWCSLTANFDNDKLSKPCDVYRCPPDWWMMDATCYHIPHRRDVWAQGSASCEYADGSLADVTQPSTFSFLLNKMNSLKITVVWVGPRSKRTSNVTVMTTASAVRIAATNVSNSDYDENGPYSGQDCRAIFAQLQDGSPPKLLQVVNCSEEWHFICMKQASLMRGSIEAVTEQWTAEHRSLTQVEYSANFVHAMIAVGSVVILLLALSWPVYYIARWLQNRDSSEDPQSCFSYLKLIKKPFTYKPLEE